GLERWDGIDFLVHAIGFADKAYLRGRYLDTPRSVFLQAMDISCYSFTAVAQRAVPMMRAGGSLLTLTYLGAERWVPHYNVMGVAKAASMLASSATSQGTTSEEPTEAASGRTRRSSASPWKVKARSAPWAAQAAAMPQASERSFATPMIRPRLPCIRLPFNGSGAGSLSAMGILCAASLPW
ncbi:MAG: SDR family oxidoreductase, partial [Rhodospirillales bacterium]|nr:SDR family oxidoreductase [Rhodospirillales bacterium]